MKSKRAIVNNNKRSTLLPCPFCGSEAFIWPIIGNMFKVSCKKDCITMPSRFDCGFTSIEQAQKYWNTRMGKEF